MKLLDPLRLAADTAEAQGYRAGAACALPVPDGLPFALGALPATADAAALACVVAAVEARVDWARPLPELLDGIARDYLVTAASCGAVPPHVVGLERAERVRDAVACERLAIVAARWAAQVRSGGAS